MLHLLLLSTYFEPNLAFWWYIPIIIGGILGTIALLSGPQKTEGKSLGVLGMVSSGKTSFLANLGVIDKLSAGTTVESYAERKIKIKDREILIQQGQDIGGAESFVVEFYKKWIMEKDIIIFIFDGERYISDDDYRKDSQARMHFIYTCFMDKNAGKTTDEQINSLKNVVIIASHSDQYENGAEQMRTDIINSITDKDYKDLFNTNVYGADLRNRQDVQSIADKIF